MRAPFMKMKRGPARDRVVRSLRTAAIIIAAASGVTTLLSGCNIVGPAAYLIEGPPTLEAQFVLPSEKIVVFLDDRATVIPRSALRRALAMKATQTIVEDERLVPGGIAPDAAVRIAQQEEYGEPLSIAEIGRRVGAGVVIYAVPEQFGVYSADGMPQPTCAMRVRVIDVATETQLWPLDGSYHYLVAEMALRSQPSFDAGSREQFETTLAEFAGLRLAQLFFEHEPNPLDGRVSQ